MDRSFGATPKDVAHIEKKPQRKCLLKVELSDVVEQDDVSLKTIIITRKPTLLSAPDKRREKYCQVSAEFGQTKE